MLKSYTPVVSYYKLIKKTDDDPEFDTKKEKKLLAAGKIGGQARAMVVTSGIERAIQYFHACKTYLVERKSPYRAA